MEATQETVERMLADAKKAAAGQDCIVVETDIPGSEVAVFRVPTSMEWLRYRTALRGTPGEGAAAGRALVICCCIYPDQQAFATAIDKHPGLVESYSGELVEHAGIGRVKKVSKL